MKGIKKTVVYIESREDLTDLGVSQSVECIQSKEDSDHHIRQLAASLYFLSPYPTRLSKKSNQVNLT